MTIGAITAKITTAWLAAGGLPSFGPNQSFGGQNLPGLNLLVDIVNNGLFALGCAGALGMVVAGVQFMLNAKRGHGAGVHHGHNLLIGSALALVIGGGANALITAFFHAGSVL